MGSVGKKPSITDMLGWVNEAENAHRDWRAESWEDYEFRDNKHWKQQDYTDLMNKGINPLTINRIFPVVNLLSGHYNNNRQDIVAKGRTQLDHEISQVMTEAIAFIMDTYGGYDLISRAFSDQVIPGIGFLAPGLNQDPRKERVKLEYIKWYSMWWDPYADPWLSPETCKYAYRAEWKDTESLKLAFPSKAADIEDHVGEMSASPDLFQNTLDIGTEVEDQTRFLSSRSFVGGNRRRVRPVEMWYTVPKKVWFSIMPDGTAQELDPEGDPNGAFQAVQASEQTVATMVKKVRVRTFLGKLVLQDSESPYPHEQYPFVPFVGYLDRYNHPFGVVRMIKEQNMEVNKRRSMALSLISSRRTIMEKNTAENPEHVYEEANSQDGFIVLNDGKKGTFEIQEMAQLAQPQLDLLHDSEREIKEIAGTNDESLGYKSPAESNVALENKQNRSFMMTSELLKNLKKSQRLLGEQVSALVQNEWTGERVLRVTDRMSGVEKFVEVNQPYYSEESGTIEVRNNITNGRFDIVITDRPMTDTVREKNLELIFSAIQKSPPEAIAPLLSLALELSDLPHKDRLLQQIRMVLGVEPIDPLLSTAEAEAKAKERQAAIEQQAQQEAAFDQQMKQLELQKKEAEIAKAYADIEDDKFDNAHKLKEQNANLWKQGYELRMKLEQQRDTSPPPEPK